MTDAHDAFHELSAEQALRRLETRRDGLDPQEARRRLEEYGPNVLRGAEEVGALRVLLRQLESVVILVLVAATTSSPSPSPPASSTAPGCCSRRPSERR